VVAPAGASRPLRRARRCLCNHAAGCNDCAHFLLRYGARAMDRRPQLDGQRAPAYRRTLDDPRAAGALVRVLDRDLRRGRLAPAASAGRVLHDRRAAVDRHRRPAQDADQRRLPLGPRRLRRPVPVCRVVRRPARCTAYRTLLPGGARQLRLRAARPILHVSRAARGTGEARTRRRRAGGTDLRPRAAGAWRALRLARPVERVRRLDGHAVGVHVRVPGPVVGIHWLRCIA